MYVLILTWMFSMPNGHKSYQQDMTVNLTEIQCITLSEERKKSLLIMGVEPNRIEAKCVLAKG